MANDRLESCESASRCLWRKSGYIKDKMGLNSKINLAVNKRGLPVEFIVTDGTRAYCKEALTLSKTSMQN